MCNFDRYKRSPIFPKWWSMDQREAFDKYEQDPEWAIGYWIGNLRGYPTSSSIGKPAQPMSRQKVFYRDDGVSLRPLEDTIKYWAQSSCVTVKYWGGQSLWVVAIKITDQYEGMAWGEERIIIGSILPYDLPNDISDIVKLRAGELDLGGAILGSDSKSINLAGVDLRGANLNNADLRNVCLSSARLWDADLRGANLSGAILNNAEFMNADLRGADLTNTNLHYAKFMGANLRGMALTNASIFRTNIDTRLIDEG